MLKWAFAFALAVLLVLTFAFDSRFGALGALLLLAAIVYAVVSNRTSTARGEVRRAERGARELREEIEEDNAAEQRGPARRAP